MNKVCNELSEYLPSRRAHGSNHTLGIVPPQQAECGLMEMTRSRSMHCNANPDESLQCNSYSTVS